MQAGMGKIDLLPPEEHKPPLTFLPFVPIFLL
jgi:hypothetical protein